MSKQPVVIIGSSGHAKVVIDIFEKQGTCEIISLLGEEKNIGSECLGYSVTGTEESIPKILSKHPSCKAFVAIGDNHIRQKVASKLLSISPTLEFAIAIHPSAQIGRNVQIGNGSAVMAGAIVNSGTSIGDGCIINTSASVDHDCNIGEYAAILPGATIGGNVTIGNSSVVCIGAVVKQGIIIGNNTVIGAGALLLENLGDNVLAYGSPAKVVKSRNIGERYL